MNPPRDNMTACRVWAGAVRSTDGWANIAWGRSESSGQFWTFFPHLSLFIFIWLGFLPIFADFRSFCGKIWCVKKLCHDVITLLSVVLRRYVSPSCLQPELIWLVVSHGGHGLTFTYSAITNEYSPHKASCLKNRDQTTRYEIKCFRAQSWGQNFHIKYDIE